MWLKNNEDVLNAEHFHVRSLVSCITCNVFLCQEFHGRTRKKPTLDETHVNTGGR